MKARIVMTLLCVVFLWPLVHRGLVAQYHLNPWKLGGFAMYTSARPPILVSVIDGDGVPRAEAGLSPTARDALRSFRLRRHVWGALREPDVVARILLAESKHWKSVTIVVAHPYLDSSTGLMEHWQERYVYDRS